MDAITLSLDDVQIHAPLTNCVPTAQRATLAKQFLQFMLTEKCASRHTVKSYRADLVQFTHFISGTIGQWNAGRTAFGRGDDIDETLLRCDAPALRAFQSYLEAHNYTESSIARKLAALKSFYKFLIRRDMLSVNPLSTILPPRQAKRSPRLLDSHQARILLDAPGYGSLLAARDSAILELLYSTGIRASEMVNLKVTDLDLPAGLVHIGGASPAGRLVPIGPQTARAIERYFHMRARESHLKPQQSDRVFLNKLGRPLSTRSVRRKLDKYLARAGLAENISPSTLRHSFAVQSLNDGVDLRRVKELLGFRNLTSAQIYSRLAARERAENQPVVTVPTAIPQRPRAA